MSRWKTEFDNQRVVSAVQDSLQILESSNTEALTPDHLAEFGRLLKVLKFLREHFAALDPELCPQNTFVNCAGSAANLLNNTRAYVQNRNIGNLQQANSFADALLTSSRVGQSGIAPENGRAIIEANTALHKKIVEELRSKANEVNAELNTLARELAGIKIRSKENDEIIQKQKGRLDESIAEFQKQFSKSQEGRIVDYTNELRVLKESFAKEMAEKETRFKNMAEVGKQAFDAVISNTQGLSEQHLKLLEERKDQVNKIFGAIGSAAFAGNFKITADADGKAADRWRLTAVVLMVFIGAFAIAAFIYSITNPKDWEMFLFRLGTCLFLAVPAFYAASESSKHRERERLNRKLHLELTAIDAYLALLPENQRNDIKGKLSERFFGVPELTNNTEAVTGQDLFGLVKTAVANLTKGK